MRTTPGYLVLTDDDRHSDTVFGARMVGERRIPARSQSFGEFGTNDVSKEPAVVIGLGSMSKNGCCRREDMGVGVGVPVT